jgi:hypothetical protein
MVERGERLAVTRWVIQHDVFVFYGNGGRFAGEAYERWYEALEATSGLVLYVGGGGSVFDFGPAERSRGNELFKRKQLPFAVVTENTMHRVLGSTARLLGVKLSLFSWEESRKPFAELKASAAIVDTLHQTLLRLREEIDAEVAGLL